VGHNAPLNVRASLDVRLEASKAGGIIDGETHFGEDIKIEIGRQVETQMNQDG
jgi:hypothetical protein